VGGASVFDDGYQPSLVGGGKGDTGGRLETGYRPVGSLRAGGREFCSATLILPNAVLTAAHCLQPILDGSIFDQLPLPSAPTNATDGGAPTDLSMGDPGGAVPGGPADLGPSHHNMAVGLSAMRPIATFALGAIDAPEQETELDLKAAAHDDRYVDEADWGPLDQPHHDIAIIFLKAPINGVAPARVAKLADPLPDPCALRSIGYGITDLVTAYQERRSGIKCYQNRTADGSDIHVYQPTGATCYGDSGGGLVYASADEPVHLLGVASRLGEEVQYSDPCTFGSTSYFTDAYAHKDFISATLEKFSP
jgi:hypothetical protein